MADTVIKKTCRTCKKEFVITYGEMKWLTKHKLAPFEHCAECRKKRKDNNGRIE